MGKLGRAFRGADIAQERQFQPVYRALEAGLDSANVAALGIMPIGTVATTGGVFLTVGGNVNWSVAALSFASSAASQTVSFTHGLSRVPQFFVDVMRNPLQLAIIPTNVSAWNTSVVQFALPNDTVSNVFKIWLI